MRLGRFLTVLLVAPMLLPSVAGGTVEDALRPLCDALGLDEHFCTYQADGQAHGDAEATCGATTRQIAVGAPYAGMLAPVDGDESDAYLLVIPSELVEVQLVVRIMEPPAQDFDGVHHATTLELQGLQESGGPCGSVIGAATPGDPLVFTPSAAGHYGVRVFVQDALPSSAQAISVKRVCHLMCVQGTLTNATGYDFYAEPI